MIHLCPSYSFQGAGLLRLSFSMQKRFVRANELEFMDTDETKELSGREKFPNKCKDELGNDRLE